MTTVVLTRDTRNRAEGRISGAVLRTFRHRLGLLQEEMAERLLMDLDTYRARETGRRPLSRIPVYRFHALRRALVELGIPRMQVGVLDAAIGLDLDIARALTSDENVFPPDGCTETWQALLAWALHGRAPLVFAGWSRVERPRLATRDRNILLARIANREETSCLSRG